MSTDADGLGPLRFEPILKRLIWGGRRLGTVLGKPIGPESDYAESWEVSDHRHGQSVVAVGPLRGATLHELTVGCGPELLGPAVAPRDQFPLLVKFIDARRVLSVQVHPDDEGGRRLADDNGKNESWVVLDAEPGGRIFAGLKSGVTRDQFEQAIDDGTVEALLHSFEPAPGDCIHVPAGTVHAIGAGVMLAEVQQMSDATFRVFDWGRLGDDGRPRRLHLAEAMESIAFSRGPVDPVRPRPDPIPGGVREALVRCPQFHLDRLRLDGPATLGDPSASRFTLLVGLGGTLRLAAGGDPVRLKLGETLLLPATLGAAPAEPEGGEAIALTATVP